MNVENVSESNEYNGGVYIEENKIKKESKENTNKLICVLGTDARSKYLRKLYKDEGKNIVSYDNADVIIGPTPFSIDDIRVNGESLECDELIKVLSDKRKTLYAGSLSNSMKEKFIRNNINFYDLLDQKNVAFLNAIPTAEGAIKIAMEMTDFTIHGSNILVLGYGKIGKILSKMLKGIGANVFCEARKKEDLAFIKAMGYNSIHIDKLDNYLNEMNIIFNTIPSMILDERRLQCLKPDCVVIDLASTPGGVDFLKAKELNINTTWALSLPTKVAPYTAAVYLKDTLDELLEKG